MGTVLVTGHKGYIGQVVRHKLEAGGTRVIGLDAKGIHQAGESQDVVNRRVVDAIFQPVDAVIHLAALVSVAESEDPVKAADYWAVNVGGTVNVMNAAARHGVKRFIYASTAAIDAEPRSVYAETKWAAETVLRKMAGRLGMSVFILRLTNVAGGNHESRTHLIPNLVRSAKTGEDFYLTADPDRTRRDFVHVEDAAEAFIHFAQRPSAGLGASSIAIGSGVSHSIKEVIAALHGETGLYPNIIQRNRRTGDPLSVHINPSKASSYGWTATRDLGVILRDAIDLA